MKKVKPIFNGAELAVLFVYICSISSALMYVLCKSHAFLCSLIMTAVCFGIYWIFYKLRLKKLFALLAFIGLLVLVNIVCGAVGTGYGEYSFMRFIFTSSDFFNPFYAAAAILLFSMIIGFSTSYFSVYLPRPCFLLLPAFIPLILAARTAGGLPLGLIIFMAVGFMLAAMGLARPESPSGEVYIDDRKARKERLLAMAALGVAAALILMIVPRPETTRYSEVVDNIMFNPRNSRNYFGSQQLSNFQDRSIPNTGNNNPSDSALFTAVTYAPMNVAKGSFDVYLGKDGWIWANDKDLNNGHQNWEDGQRILNYSTLINKLKRASAEGKLKKYKEELDKVPASRSYNAAMTIRVTDGSNTSVILHPNKTYKVTVDEYSGSVYRNAKNEIFTTANFGANGSYVLNYWYEQPNAEFIDMISRVGFGNLLADALEEGVIELSEYSGFAAESVLARDYQWTAGYYQIKANDRNSLDEYGETVTQNDPRITELAEEITAGLSNDYEKALAIEKWFGEAGFVYDLDFVPDEPTAEYFLFKSNRGICTDFASASTLLLRAAGLCARYTEGFTMPEDIKDDMGRYVVTAAQAHAYSEVFIEGFGWLTVDGTRYAEVGSSIEDAMRLAALIIVCVLAVLITLAVIFRRQISEFFFALGLKFKDKNGRIKAVYFRTRKLACEITGIDPKTATAEETLDIINRTLYISDEAQEITDAANELFYSKKEPEADDRRLYENYKSIRNMKRSLKR